MAGKTQSSLTATEQDILYCFRLLLGREPSSKEWLGHVSRVGDCLDDVVATYLNSQEFHNRALLQPGSSREVEFVELDGFGMFASPDDLAVGKHLIWLKDYEPHVSQHFRKKLKPGMRVLDIGANIGFYSLLAASRVGPTGEVVAVEPNPANVELILRSKKRNNFENIRVVQAAAYNRWEPLALFLDCSNGSVGSVESGNGDIAGNTVMGLPVSAAIGNAPLDLVKIDVEGAEGRAIEGILAVIAGCKPLVFSEFTPESMPNLSGMSGEDYLRMFTSLGYGITLLDKYMGAIDCGMNSDLIMKAYESATDSHVDVMFEFRS